MNLSNNTVEQLRRAGYKVRCSHWRYVHWDDNAKGKSTSDFIPRPQKEIKGINRWCKGGITDVEITTPDGFNYFGRAKCHIKDNFNRKMGVKIALGRLEPVVKGVETE